MRVTAQAGFVNQGMKAGHYLLQEKKIAHRMDTFFFSSILSGNRAIVGSRKQKSVITLLHHLSVCDP